MRSRTRLWGPAAVFTTLAGGIALAPAALSGSMTAYVLQVVILMGISAPLFVLAFRNPQTVTSGGLSFVKKALGHPILALLIFNITFFYWFAPSIHRAVYPRPGLYTVSLMTLLIAAIWMWQPLMRPFTEGPSPMARLGYILLATIPQTFAGITMALTKPDEATAGAILALASKTSLFVAFAILFARLMREADEGDDDDGGSSQPGEVPPELPSRTTESEKTRKLEEALVTVRQREIREIWVSDPARRSARPR